MGSYFAFPQNLVTNFHSLPSQYLSAGQVCAPGNICFYSVLTEDAPTNLSCSSGTLHVASAAYSVGGKSESCTSSVAETCDGLSSCDVEFSNSSCNGDPDYGYVKYGTAVLACNASLFAAGNGCSDGYCLDITGTGFTAFSKVYVHDAKGNLLNTYSGKTLKLDLTSNPNVGTLALASSVEKTDLRETGLSVSLTTGLSATKTLFIPAQPNLVPVP